MSKLESKDYICCFHCNTRMDEILLCNNRSGPKIIDGFEYNQRCHHIACEDCKLCVGCHKRIQEMHNELKRLRYGKKDEDTFGCKWFLDELKNQHNIIPPFSSSV